MLFALLAAKFPTASAIAAALGITRQAYSQAAKRGRLSDSAILRAAELLKLDPGPLLIERAQLATVKRDEAPAPILPPSPASCDTGEICQSQTLYYVKFKNTGAELADSWHAADAVICKTGCLSHGGHWRDADQHCRRKGSRCDHPGAGDVHRTSASLAETVTPGS